MSPGFSRNGSPRYNQSACNAVLRICVEVLNPSNREAEIKRETGCFDMRVRGCLEITVPTLSHHMKELEIAGLITVRRSGKFINYEFWRDVLESFLASLRREFM
jgi:DNA-binding transcriptional ArsR family regulator